MNPHFQAKPDEAEIPPLPFSGREIVKGSADADTSRQTEQTQPFTDEAREAAICRAGFLIEFFDAEVRCFDALYERTSCLDHKGAADGARLNKAKAEDLHAALVRGRRAEAAA